MFLLSSDTTVVERELAARGQRARTQLLAAAAAASVPDSGVEGGGDGGVAGDVAGTGRAGLEPSGLAARAEYRDEGEEDEGEVVPPSPGPDPDVPAVVRAEFSGFH